MSIRIDSKSPLSYTAILLAAASIGCAGAKPVPMDPSRPIETKDGYKQDGKALDEGNMLDRLSEEPASQGAVTRARVLATTAVILAGVGGALVGWPLGTAAAGEDPMWELAAVGGGVIVVAIPLAIWSSASVSSAVDSHNQRFGNAPQSRNAPPEVAVFRF